LSFTEEVGALILKASCKLKHAEHAFGEGDYDSAVGDAYRCIGLCMRALLLNKGICRLPKTHGGLLQLFTRELVLSGDFPRSLMRGIGEVMSMRPRADYAPALVGIDEAEKALKAAREVLEQSAEALHYGRLNP